MTGRWSQEVRAPLRSALGLLERQAARRAKGAHPGMLRLHDDKLADLVALLRRELGTDEAREAVAG